jgi:hypothetical protein
MARLDAQRAQVDRLVIVTVSVITLTVPDDVRMSLPITSDA